MDLPLISALVLNTLTGVVISPVLAWFYYITFVIGLEISCTTHDVHVGTHGAGTERSQTGTQVHRHTSAELSIHV
jgi:hypothetical protein